MSWNGLSKMSERAQELHKYPSSIQKPAKDLIETYTSELNHHFTQNVKHQGHISDVVKEAVLRYIEKSRFMNISDPYRKDSRNLRRVLKGLDIQLEDHSLFYKTSYYIKVMKDVSQSKKQSLLKPLLTFFYRYWREVFLSFEDKHKKWTLRILEKGISWKNPESKRLKFFEENQNYFLSQEGPSLLARKILNSLLSCEDYFYENNFSNDVFESSWYSTVMVEYWKLSKIRNLNDLVRLKRSIIDCEPAAISICFALIVLNYEGNKELKNKIFTAVIERIGDPIEVASWILPKIWEEYQEILDAAKNIIQSWINREVVDYFYSTLIINQERKEFWQDYASAIPEIYIMMNNNSSEYFQFRHRLPEDIRQRVINRIIRCQGGITTLIMYTDNHMLIEFAEKSNAFYAYHKDRSEYRRPSAITNMKNPKLLKNTSIMVDPHAMTTRLIHTSGIWKSRFRNWLKDYAELIPEY